MKRLILQMQGGYINIPADHLERDIENNVIYAYDGAELVAVIDVSSIITLHISEAACK